MSETLRQETLSFVLGRSIFPLLLADVRSQIVSEAFTWDQAAGRAFAAELFAPAKGLAGKVGAIVFPEKVAALAQEFNVSPRLIEHQIVNHDLAIVIAD